MGKRLITIVFGWVTAIRPPSIRVGTIVAAALFSTCVAAGDGVHRRPQAQVFVGYTGIEGDSGEKGILLDFLNELSREAPNTLFLSDPVPLKTTWSSSNAVNIVSQAEQDAEQIKGYPVRYDHYVIAKMDKELQRYCRSDVYMTKVTFEVGRFSNSPSGRRVIFFSYPSDKLYFQIGHPNFELKECLGSAAVISEQDGSQWVGQQIDTAVARFMQTLYEIFPNVRKYDDNDRFLFFLSCLEVNRQKVEWTVDDILKSTDSPQEESAGFFAKIVNDLVNHPSHRGFFVPWKFAKLEFEGEQLERLKSLCLQKNIPIDDPQKEYVYLHATLTDPGPEKENGMVRQTHGVTLKIDATDRAWQKSLDNAKPPRDVPLESFNDMIDAARNEITGYTLVSCSTSALSAIAEDELAIDKVAMTVRELVDEQRLPTQQELKAACEPKKD